MTTLTRAFAGARRRAAMLRERGDAVWCPVCGHAFRRFKDAWNRPDALCWRCGSHERHRAQWLLFERRPELLGGCSALLHFAPEYCLRTPLARAARRDGFRYETADLDATGVDLHLDVTRLALADGAYDAILCSHVLEHVPDDRGALRELRRVTAPGGWCLVMVPLDLAREQTYEDPSITTPEARLAAYWQPDHVRLFGRDVAERVRAAGFEVAVLQPREAFGEALMRRARLLESDWLLLCQDPAATSAASLDRSGTPQPDT